MVISALLSLRNSMISVGSLLSLGSGVPSSVDMLNAHFPTIGFVVSVGTSLAIVVGAVVAAGISVGTVVGTKVDWIASCVWSVLIVACKFCSPDVEVSTGVEEAVCGDCPHPASKSKKKMKGTAARS